MLNYEIIKRDKFYVERGYHPKNSIIIVLSGKFKCAFSETKYVAETDDCVVFCKESAFVRKVITPIECIYLQFDEFPLPLKNGIIEIEDRIRLKSTVEYLKKAIEASNEYLINHFVEDLFVMVKRSDAADTAAQCINYLSANFEKPLTLDMIAEELHLSKQWLIVKFKKHTGSTPIEYLNTLRIQHGKSLLANSELPVYKIAELCGFENVYYFSGCFKKRTGVSPTQYRKSFRL